MSGITEFTPEFFEEASKAWRSNKVPTGEGAFRYKQNAFPPISKVVAVALTVSPSVRRKQPILRRSPRLLAKKRAAK